MNSQPIITSYIYATRPWSFSASFIPVLLGNVLALEHNVSFDYLLMFLTLVCVLALHTGGNLTNTYYDYVNGVDKPSSDDKTLVNHELQPATVHTMSMFAYFVGITAFLLIVKISSASTNLLAFLFVIGLSGSFLYTGSIALKYHAFGDVVIILLFGPLAVISSYAVQTGSLALSPIILSIPLALFTEAILHANNSRDRIEDEQAGIKTLAILIGDKMSYFVYVWLLFVPYIFCLFLTIYRAYYYLLPLLTSYLALSLKKEFEAGKLNGLPQETAKVNSVFGVIYVVAVYLSL